MARTKSTSCRRSEAGRAACAPHARPRAAPRDDASQAGPAPATDTTAAALPRAVNADLHHERRAYAPGATQPVALADSEIATADQVIVRTDLPGPERAAA